MHLLCALRSQTTLSAPNSQSPIRSPSSEDALRTHTQNGVCYLELLITVATVLVYVSRSTGSTNVKTPLSSLSRSVHHVDIHAFCHAPCVRKKALQEIVH